MNDKKAVERAIQQLEAAIKELRDSLDDWDNRSVNNSGAKMYKEKARRVVFQAQAVESQIKENVFPT
jgi:chaperonin cofactor prefoldin